MQRNPSSRRSFLKGLTIGAAALTPPLSLIGCDPLGGEGEGLSGEGDALITSLVDQCGASAATQPNLLIIHSDQQDSWTIGNYGGTLVSTPNIDWLASQGVALDNFFTNGATCTPSRGCLMSGLYPHEHGAYRNNEPMKTRDQGVVTIAHSLADAGYKTGYVGKWHLAGHGDSGPGWRPAYSAGFDDKTYMYDTGHYKEFIDQTGGSPPKVSFHLGNSTTYSTDWMATKSINFLRQNKANRFFFMVAFPDPHDPYKVRTPYSDAFKAGMMPVPATFRPDGRAPTAAELAELRQNMAQYCGMVKCIDDNVGRILRALDDLDLAKNTVVVFMTDHGDYMGEHGRYGKDYYYERALRIPCIVRYPGKVPCGRRVGRMVSMIDLSPTLLALMNVTDKAAPRGHSAAKLLQGMSDPTWVDDVHVHRYYQDKYTLNDFACLFTPDYELVVQKDDPSFLFRRADYPDHLVNLYGDSGYTSIRRELERRMLAHHTLVNSPLLTWLKTKISP